MNMDANFGKMHKILSGLDFNQMSSLLNSSGDDIKETYLFNKHGSFNQELLTKEGFIKNLTGNANTKMNDIYGQLFDAIANIDDNPNMSEEELKFIASFGKESDKNTISKDDFYSLGIIGRDTEKYAETNSRSSMKKLEKFLSRPYINIVSPKKTKPPVKITAVNDELNINGKIDEPVIQGNIGDCWLLSGINALNASEKGREIIRNAIIPNKNGTVTINFAGVSKKITITAEEIKKHDTDTNFHDNYSNGDNDALVLEIGMKKLIKENPKLFLGQDKDIDGGQTFNFWKALIPNYNIAHIQDETPKAGKDAGISRTNRPSGMYAEKIRELFKNALNNKNIAAEFLIDGHSMAITEITENQVAYIDSMNYAKTSLSWEEFINKNPKAITYTDLSRLQNNFP